MTNRTMSLQQSFVIECSVPGRPLLLYTHTQLLQNSCRTRFTYMHMATSQQLICMLYYSWIAEIMHCFLGSVVICISYITNECVSKNNTVQKLRLQYMQYNEAQQSGDRVLACTDDVTSSARKTRWNNIGISTYVCICMAPWEALHPRGAHSWTAGNDFSMFGFLHNCKMSFVTLLLLVFLLFYSVQYILYVYV